MGRGAPALAEFRRALRREDQSHLDRRLFESARLHLQAGVYASNPWPMESVFLSMLLEHQKALSALQLRLQRLEEPENGIKTSRATRRVAPLQHSPFPLSPGSSGQRSASPS